MKQNTITIDLETAKKIYGLAPKEIRQQLVEKFGKENFVQNPLELKTMDDVYDFLGMNQQEIDEIESIQVQDKRCYERIKKIARALNPKEFIPDFDNSNQKKWGPYFNGGESGFGFSGSFYDYTYTVASLGSLLCYASEEISDYAGKTFTEIYKGFIINKF